MVSHDDNCLTLVKRVCRAQARQTLSSEEQNGIIQVLLDRINAGIADRRLIPYLNRLTATEPVCGPDSHISPLRGRVAATVRRLYEALIAGAETPQSLPYLLRALRSTYSERKSEPKFVSKPEVVREESEPETGPDQCGHLNNRATYYKVYATYHHYDRIRPLAEKAAERLHALAEEGFISADNVARAIDHVAGQIRLDDDVVTRENREYDRYEIEGDRGYW